MKALLPPVFLSLLLAPVAPAIAAEWQQVTKNAAGDTFFVDTSSIEQQGKRVFYWEYRQFPTANNALLEVELPQPLHGAVMRWSVNCDTMENQLWRVNAYTQDRQLINKFSYGQAGKLVNPYPGSSTQTVATFVCNDLRAASPAKGAVKAKDSVKGTTVQDAAVQETTVKDSTVKDTVKNVVKDTVKNTTKD
jgi:hypothetical protein